MPDTTTFALHAWTRPWRILAGFLLVATGLGIVLLIVAILLATDPPVTPPIARHLFFVQVVLPGAAALGVRRLSRAELTIDPASLILRTRNRRIDVPRASIVGFEPWRLPLPGPGVAIRLQSGRRLAWALEARDPEALLAALGAPERAREHPTVRWGQARATRPAGRWWRLALKYPGLAMPFALLFFYTHQHIAYGGFFGQWNLLGWRAWLGTLLEYWTTVVIYFLLWGGCMRGLAEGMAWLTAAVAPRHAAAGRRIAKRLDAIAYVAGIVLATVLRYLA